MAYAELSGVGAGQAEPLFTLSGHEQSLVVWTLALFALALCNGSIRGGLWEVLKSATGLSRVVAGFFAWFAVVVFVGHRVGVWNWDVLNDTVLWVFTVGLGLLFSFARVGEHRFVRILLARTLGFTALIEGLASLESMPLVVELVFVPFASLLSLMLVVTARQPNHEPVQHLLNGVTGALGGLYLAYVAAQLAYDFDPAHVVRALALPAWLALGVLPFLYGVALRDAYRAAFSVRIDFATEDRDARRTARRALRRAAGCRVSNVNGFAGHWIRDLIDDAEAGHDGRAVMARWRREWRLEAEIQHEAHVGELLGFWLEAPDDARRDIWRIQVERAWPSLGRYARFRLKVEAARDAPSASVAAIRGLPD